MNCIDIPALQGLGDFTPMQRWIQRVREIAAQHRLDAHKVIASTIRIAPKDAKDVSRITDLNIRPSPADAASHAGNAKVAATAKAAQAAAAFHKAQGDTIEAQMRKLLDDEEKATGAQKDALRTQIARLASSLACERVNASRSTIVGGALRAAVKLHNDAASTSNPTVQATRVNQAVNAVAVAHAVAVTPVRVGLPQALATDNGGVLPPRLAPSALRPRGDAPIPNYISYAMEAKPNVAALQGLGGVVDDFRNAVLNFFKTVKNPIPAQPLIASVLKNQSVANAGIVPPTPNPALTKPSIFNAVAHAAGVVAPSMPQPGGIPFFPGTTTTHQAIPVTFPGAHTAVPVMNSGVRSPPMAKPGALTHGAMPVTTHQAVPVNTGVRGPTGAPANRPAPRRRGLHGLGDTLVHGTILPDVNMGPTMPSLAPPYEVPNPAPVPFTGGASNIADAQVAKEINDQIPAATPAGMEPATKSKWSALLVPGLVVGAGLVLQLAS